MELPSRFGPVNTRREGTDREPEGEPHQNGNMLIPYLGILSLENREKHISIVCKLPSLCYFVIAAQMTKTIAMINGYYELEKRSRGRDRASEG